MALILKNKGIDLSATFYRETLEQVISHLDIGL